MGAEVNGPKGRCKPRGAECCNYCPSLSTSHGGETTTEPPREGKKPGAIALVGASTCSSNTERQRAAQETVFCLLPAPDGDTKLLGGSLVNQMGVRGRRHKNTECFSRRRPPVALCLLCRRGQSRSPRRAKPSQPRPQAKFPHAPLWSGKAGNREGCPYGNGQRAGLQTWGRRADNIRPYGSGQRAGLQTWGRRADDIRPYRERPTGQIADLGRTGGYYLPPPKREKLPAAGGRRPPLRKTETPKGEEEGSICPILFLRAQRRSEASQEVLCQAFFQESGGGLEFF